MTKEIAGTIAGESRIEKMLLLMGGKV